MRFTKLLLLTLMVLTMQACKVSKRKVVIVQEYKTPNTATATADDYLYWYTIWGWDNSCYYYTSSYPVTDLSSATWMSSNNGLPGPLEDVDAIADVIIELQELPASIQPNIAESSIEAN